MTILKLIFASLVVLSLDAVNGMRRVCYYTNWAQYRPGVGKFVPDNIDPHLCTHLVFAFAKLKMNRLHAFEWNDESTEWQTGMYQKFNDLKKKNPKLKTLLAVGGWNMGSAGFTQMVGSNKTIQDFARSTVRFLRHRNFDGLDLDWEYPANRGSPPEDKVRYTFLVSKLRQEFDNEAISTNREPLLLTSAVAAGKTIVESGYNIPILARDMDFISVMTYDLHGSWENTTGHNSPLYARKDETGKDRYLNLEWAAKNWQNKGVPPSKLNVGLALYGRTFTLLDPSNHGVGAPVKATGHKGKYTREAGFLSYYEICNLIQKGATRYYIEEQKVPYLVHGDQWIGYDDPESLATKVDHIKNKTYGGIMVWALDLDDFSKQCEPVRYPLLKSIVNKIGGVVPMVPEVNTQKGKGSSIILPDKPVIDSLGSHKPKNEFICRKDQDGIFASPYSCKEYYNCQGGTAHNFKCAPGLMFNNMYDSCDWPANVECNLDQVKKEQARLQAEETTTPTPAPKTEPPQLWLLNPTNNGQPNTQAPALQAQLLIPSTWQQPLPTKPQSANNANPAIQFLEPPTTSRPSQQHANALPYAREAWDWVFSQNNAPRYWDLHRNRGNGFCASRSSGIFPHPTNCSKFIECANGMPFTGSCGTGTVFNIQHSTCAYDSGGNPACASV